MNVNYFLLCMLCFCMAAQTSNAQSIGVGTNTPDSSAMLEVKASNKGMLVPRTSTASRIAITRPAKGLILYDTTTSSFWFYQDTAWANLAVNTSLSGIPMAGDYDNDGRADISMYFPVEHKWTVRLSLNGNLSSYIFTTITTTNVTPLPVDYDGDGKTDMTLYDSNAKKWIVRRSSDGVVVTISF